METMPRLTLPPPLLPANFEGAPPDVSEVIEPNENAGLAEILAFKHVFLHLHKTGTDHYEVRHFRGVKWGEFTVFTGVGYLFLWGKSRHVMARSLVDAIAQEESLRFEMNNF